MRKQKINKVVGSVVVGVSLVGCMNGVSAATKTWDDMTDLENSVCTGQLQYIN